MINMVRTHDIMYQFNQSLFNNKKSASPSQGASGEAVPLYTPGEICDIVSG